MEVRLAAPADADAVAEVFVDSFGSLTFLPRLHTDDEQRSFIRNVVLATREVWVAVDGGSVVGFAALADDVLEHLYVRRDVQRRGAGTALLAKAKERRPRGFTFWVFQQNDRARAFYEARGCRLSASPTGAGTRSGRPTRSTGGASRASPKTGPGLAT